jgi:hypothetical protein
MTTLTFPEALRQWQSQVSWHLEPNTAAFVSPLSRTAQTLEMAGARWVCDMTFPAMRADKWRTYTAWLAKMRGQAGRVYFGPPHYRGSNAPSWIPASAPTFDSDSAFTFDSSTTPTFDATGRSPWGTPVVDGSSQSGNTLATSGWVNNVTVMVAGDFLSYATARGRTLHMAVEDAVSNGYGECSLRVEPPIRTSPRDGEEIETDRPTCVMTLQGTMTGAPSFTPYLKAAVNLQLIEVF